MDLTELTANDLRHFYAKQELERAAFVLTLLDSGNHGDPKGLRSDIAHAIGCALARLPEVAKLIRDRQDRLAGR